MPLNFLRKSNLSGNIFGRQELQVGEVEEKELGGEHADFEAEQGVDEANERAQE